LPSELGKSLGSSSGHPAKKTAGACLSQAEAGDIRRHSATALDRESSCVVVGVTPSWPYRCLRLCWI
jgi:hypothetical protein